MKRLQQRNDILTNKMKDLEQLGAKVRDSKAVARKYAMMTIDPSEHLMKAPAFGTPRGATRHFTRTLTINSGGANSKFGMSLTPRIQDFFALSAGDVSVVVAGILVQKLYHTTPNTQYYDQNSELIAESNADHGPFEVGWTTTSTTGFNNVSVTNRGQSSCVFAVSYIQGGVPVLAGAFGLLPGREQDVGTTSATPLTVPAGAITGIVITPSFDIGYDVKINDVNATAFTTTSVKRPLFRDKWLDLGNITKARISAASVLCSYRGNMLENGGVIAAARAPSGWVPTEDDMYSSICKLPEDRYKGPLLEGCYVWWLPADDSELDFSHMAAATDSTSLYVGGEFASADGSLEVTIDVVLDFYSPLQIFERKLFPCITPEFYEALKELSALPAATCNPRHLEILKKGAGKIAKGILSGVDLAKQNPELVSAFLKALGAVALM